METVSRFLTSEDRCQDGETLFELSVIPVSCTHPAKSIGDVGWSAFIAMLGYKADWYGCRVEKVNRCYPASKTCSACGTVMLSIALHLHQWQCPVCAFVHDRDVKCSSHCGIHILNQSTVGATESNAWGQPVRPAFAAAAGQRWTKQEANLL